MISARPGKTPMPRNNIIDIDENANEKCLQAKHPGITH